MKKEKVQRFNYSRGFIRVNEDLSGNLIVTEDSSDGEGVRLGTWRLDHLIYLAKLYDKEKFGEKYEEKLRDLDDRLILTRKYIEEIALRAESRTPRFGWRKP